MNADDAYFAPAAAKRGDRLGALGILLQLFRDKPQLIQPLFRTLTDPTFNDRDRQETLALIDKADANQEAALGALWILKAYDQLLDVTTDNPTVLWARDDAAWLRSRGRKRMMQRWRLPEYWRQHGFPPQCKRIGDSDFECG